MIEKCNVCNGTGINMQKGTCWHCAGKGYNDMPEEPKQNINIVCKGFAHISSEAYKCPVCREYAQHYSLESLQSVPLHIANSYCNLADPVQKYPTFTCDNCQTIWQYLGEKEEEKE